MLPNASLTEQKTIILKMRYSIDEHKKLCFRDKFKRNIIHFLINLKHFRVIKS